jgi:HEAT repeat protein
MQRVMAGISVILFCFFPSNRLFAQDRSEVAQLVQDLKSQEGVKRRKAAASVGNLGAAARPALPTLLSVLERDRDSLVRRNLATALGEIGGEPRTIVPALAKSLKDSDPDVMAAAAASLVKFGKPAVPTLRRALSDNDHLVRKNAAEALGKMGPDASDAVSDLIAAFKGESPAGRRRDNSYKATFAEALGQIGPEAKAAIPVLEQSIAERNVDREFRRVVTEALRKMKK